MPATPRPAVTLPVVPFRRKWAATVADHAHEAVSGGMTDADEFAEYLADEITLSAKDLPKAQAIFEAVVAAWRARQADRDARGIMSNIDAAFAELNTLGIVARGDFSCCGNCASGEIHGEAPDGDWLGYVYFHHQDAERIPQGEQTYLGYGANLPHYLPKEEWDAMSQEEQDSYYSATVRTLMATTVLPVLERHGMTVTWDGEIATRILVSGVTDYLVPLYDD